ncbi:MAG: hydrogenase maturation protease [Thermoplasmata archaeon]
MPSSRLRHGTTPLPVVIGLGNEHRGDDAVGLWVARRLGPRLAGAGRVLELSSEGTRLLDLWDGLDLVIVVDAVAAHGPPGTIYRIVVEDGPLPSTTGGTSTHGVSLAEAVALGRALGRLPRRLVLYGVAGSRFEVGGAMTPDVNAAIDRVAAAIEGEIRVESKGGPPTSSPEGAARA